ncbi:glycerol kinase GlpK [Aurantivibrio plasticivorans]
MAHLLALDQGTTSSRAILFDSESDSYAIAQEEFSQYYPQDGWVEHDPREIWETTRRCCEEVVLDAMKAGHSIAAIGITNQRETTILWDRATGEPIYNAIVWQDRRTTSYCQSLKQKGLEDVVRAKTGLLLDPYFSASKIRWLLDNIPGTRARAERGELAFGTVDTFLLWRLTCGEQHKTDATNASRTALFNIHNQAWDEELLELFDIPRSLLPQVCDSADDFGVTTLFGESIPIRSMVGDQQAALVGQACFESGMAKSTYGTGCFLILNTGAQALSSTHQLLTTVGYRINGEVTYALEGSIFVAGAVVQWLRDGVGLIDSASETESRAESVNDDHGVYFVPAFTGLGAPYWDPNARGAIFGLARDTGVNEIITAALEAVCFQTKDLQRAMEADGVRPTNLRVDGGMVANNWVLQRLSDILGAKVDRPTVIETTALGAMYLAGLQVGVFNGLEDISSRWRCDRQFSPCWRKLKRDERYELWLDKVRRVRTE